jgi:hypothetical protein
MSCMIAMVRGSYKVPRKGEALQLPRNSEGDKCQSAYEEREVLIRGTEVKGSLPAGNATHNMMKLRKLRVRSR